MKKSNFAKIISALVLAIIVALVFSTQASAATSYSYNDDYDYYDSFDLADDDFCFHLWMDGICQNCHRSHEEVEGHCFTNGYCYCGVHEAINDEPVVPAHRHAWTDGVCQICHKSHEEVEGHHFVNGWCDCGALEAYSDEPAEPECPHSWNNGVCVSCGVTCESVNGAHYFVDGTCIYCKKHCEHEQWAGGESCNCPVCGVNVMKLRVEELTAAVEALGNNNGLNEEQVRSLITRMVAVATSGYAYQKDVDNLREMIESLKAPAGVTSDEVYEIVNTVVHNVTNDCYYRIGDLYSQYGALSDQIRRLDYTISQLSDAGLSEGDIAFIEEQILNETRTAIGEFVAGDFKIAIDRIMDNEARIAEILEFNRNIRKEVDDLYELIAGLDNDRFTAEDKAALEIKIKDEVSVMIHEYCDEKYEAVKNRILFDEYYIDIIVTSVKEVQAAVEAISNDYLTSADRDALEAKIADEISVVIKDYCDGQYEALKNRILFNEYFLGTTMSSLDNVKAVVEAIAGDYLTGVDKKAIEAKIAEEIAETIRGCEANFEEIAARIAKIEAKVDELDDVIKTLNTTLREVGEGYLTEEDRAALEEKIGAEIAAAIAEIKNSDIAIVTERIEVISSDITALRAAIVNLRVSVGEITEDYLTSADKAEIEAKINAVVAEAINSFVNCELNAALDRIVVAEGNIAEINEILCSIKQEINAIKCDYLTAEDRVAIEEKINAEIKKAICEFTGNGLKAVRDEIRSVDEKVATLTESITEINRVLTEIRGSYLTVEDYADFEEKLSADFEKILCEFADNDLETICSEIRSVDEKVSALAESIAEINRTLAEIEENYLTVNEGSEMEMRIRDEIHSIEVNIRAEIVNAFACFAEDDFAESIKRIDSAEATVKAINASLDTLAARIRALEESGYISRDAIEFLILTATDGMATESDIVALSSDMVARISVVCMNIESLEATINSIEEHVTALSEAGYVNASEVKAMILTMISDYAQTSEPEEAITEINAMVVEINKEMTSIREAISEAQEHQTKSESEIRLLEQSLNELINDFETINTKLQEQDAMITQQNLKIAEQTVTNRAVVVLLIVSLLASAVAIWRYSKEQ